MNKEMTKAQRTMLKQLNGFHAFPGYCELMIASGLTSYKAVDWVLSALERRGMIRDDNGDYIVTDEGRAAIAKAKGE